jgi:superfamily I DNA/RNA helicase/RecB family exonuclease
MSVGCGGLDAVTTAVGGREAAPAARLVRPRRLLADAPAHDAEQRLVVDHPQGAGPLVVLGAPGTGRTTALVETVVARVGRDGVAPDAVLVLAATRVAAAATRDRIAARLARTVREPLARTPHSYAFGLLRRVHVLDGDVPPRLISGPEQDLVLADLLAGHEAGAVRGPLWPDAIDPEIRALRGFRDELRELLMRAVERGLGPEGLADLGRRRGRPDWVSAAEVLDEYVEVTSLATPGAYDPAGIVDAAANLLSADPALLAAERERWSLVVVDDAHEATAATQRLLEVLVGDGGDVVLAGDPDAATQTFRGARPAFLTGAASSWRRADGAPARTVVLRTVHRHGPLLRAVAARVAERIGSAGVPVQRRAVPAPDAPPGSVAVHVLASPAAEAAFVAHALRDANLAGGLGWGRMAVIVRSARRTETLRRALAAAGIPVAVPATEVPVRDEPAVVPLRRALACVLDPAALTPEVAAELLTGPVGGVDAVALRRLRQALRVRELELGGDRSSDELLVAAILDPALLVPLDPRAVRGARRVAAVLAAGRAAAAQPGANAETVLWELWQSAGLAEPWRRRALSGGAAGARADRDLDAVVALFEAAARFVDRLPHAGPETFLAYLEGQDVPGDTLAERAPTSDSVTLVTPHGAAGREWDAVAIIGVQEGVWPDLRLRNSLLGAQELADVLDGRAVDGAAEGPAQRRAVLDDELRLFHVAVTRARRRLLVTAVSSEDELPSPLLDLVDPLPDDVEVRPVSDVPRVPTLSSLVAELRAVAVDSEGPPRRRLAAARRLAGLAAAGVPGADPREWYGLAPLSDPRPLRLPGEPVRVSPSKVEQFDRCPLRWLLETAAGGGGGPTASTALGTLLHEIAAEVPDGDRERLGELLEQRIGEVGLPDGWIGERERQRAVRMVAKLAEYAARARRQGRSLVAVEQDVEVRLGELVVRGQVDRLERDADGRLIVVDLKTGKSKPTNAEAERNPQLGVYQVAVEEGGFADVAPEARTSGGAELVQLGGDTQKVGVQAQPPLHQDADPDWARTLLRTVAAGMSAESFEARSGSHCRMCSVRRACPTQVEGRQVQP